MMLLVALLTIASRGPWPVRAEGAPCRTRAATPATCGVAIDVPLIVLVAGRVVHAEVMLEPGANRSTQVP